MRRLYSNCANRFKKERKFAPYNQFLDRRALMQTLNFYNLPLHRVVLYISRNGNCITLLAQKPFSHSRSLQIVLFAVKTKKWFCRRKEIFRFWYVRLLLFELNAFRYGFSSIFSRRHLQGENIFDGLILQKVHFF